MRPHSVLIVDDDKLIRWVLDNHLKKWGYVSNSAASASEALELIRRDAPDLVLLDQRLPDGTGIGLLEELREYRPLPAVILMTAFDRSDVAVKALKLGATDYLTKPVDAEELKAALERIFEEVRLRRQLDLLQEEQCKLFGGCVIIGASQVMEAVHEFTARVARTGSSNVLIAGETGTGKELVARRIHAMSDRKDRPFVAMNCSTMAEQLLESQLFGHTRGAFTDAYQDKRGLLEEIEGGTLFLDEIGEMVLGVQVKLLRVLEEKKARRVGSTREYNVDVRIIAATNRSLKAAVKAGRFREDLFYRLDVASVTIPPLRSRGEDINLLAEHFLEEFNKTCRKRFKGFAPGVKEAFRGYHWPGNVRELRNTIERGVMLEDGDYLQCQIKEQRSFQPSVDQRGNLLVPVGPTGSSLADLEKQAIILALNATQHNQSKAAKLLQISRDTLRYRMKKYQLSTD